MADLPSGAVTFLFTDIEGSTRLLKQLRDRYAQVLSEHQRLLRGAFAAHGGHEVDTQGDSFFVAFASARDAVLSAVDAQLALRSHSWPEGVQLKVRMGIHTGQAAVDDGRYTGLAVHRTARIAAAGHGGQVLVSQATQTLLEDEEEDLHVFLQDLGEHRLKDLDRPVRLYQATADGLPATFPPIRREAELAQAAESAIRPQLFRRPAVVVAAGLAVAALVAVVALLATRSSSHGLGEVRPNHVGIIDPKTNEIVDEIQVGLRPGPVAIGDGTVWVGNLDDRTLTKIDAKRRISMHTYPLEDRTPTGIAVGGGSVWVAHGALGNLAAVDPEFGQITKTITVAGEPGLGSINGAVAFGARAVWAVFGDSTLARIDPTSLIITGKTGTDTNPAGVVVANGYVWVVNADSATVQRFQPETFEQGPIGTPTSVDRQPTAIAAGGGAIWVANRDADTVTRIDLGTAGGALTTVSIPVGDAPTAVAVGAGAVWVANSGDRTVSRIDVKKRKVVKTIPVGNAPVGIAVGEGAVWVSVQSP